MTDRTPAAPSASGAPVKVRFPIAAKLIFATAALVLLLIGGFVGRSWWSTQRQYEQLAAVRTTAEIQALTARGFLTARNLADSMYSSLLVGDIDLVLDAVKSVTKGDSELIEVLVARRDGRIIARAKAGKLGESVPAALLKRLEALTQPTQLNELTQAKLPDLVAVGAPIEMRSEAVKRREGYIYLELSTKRIAQALKEIESERRRALRTALIQTVALGLAALFLGVLVAVFQGLRFGRAIRHLARVAAEVGQGNLKARAKPTTRDEIGVLSHRFNEMTERIESLLQESVQKAAIDKELERANAIQALLMPPRDVFKKAGLTYSGWSETATQMGGDWWHHYPLNEHRTLLCVGDVTGHGIPSAMLTASTKACCDTLLHGNPQVALSRFLRTLDHVIREAGKSELVMTFFAAIFDTKDMTVEFANAGHNFPILLRGGNLRALVARGGRLGDGSEFEAVKKPLHKGDLVVFLTDGIIECQNESGEEYGMRRLRHLLQNFGDDELLDLRERLLADAYNFYGRMPRRDDITLVMCRVDGGA